MEMVEENLKFKKMLKIVILLAILCIFQIGGFTYNHVLATDSETSSTTETEEKISITKLKAVIDTSNKTYTGNAKKVSVKIYNGSERLKSNKDYTITYKNNVKTGKATVIIKGIGDYTGTITKYFYIVPKTPTITSVLYNGKGTKATIQWKRDKMATGYIVYMSTSKNGSYKRLKVINDNDTTTYIKKGLSSSKTYYFKIRSFKTVNGKRVYSNSCSSIKSNTGLLSSVTLDSPMSGTNRNYNLKLASKAINGTVLKSGESFNWFKVVGQASKAKGYRKAGIFSNGTTVQGYGGGVCQVSSTLYQAALKINLKIVERHTHSQSVPYAETGKDATVSYGSKNLIIKNNKKYSIKLVTTSNKTKTTCKIYRVTD